MTARGGVPALVAGMLLIVATSAGAQDSPQRATLMRCIAQAAASGGLVETVEVDAPANRTATLMCFGEAAEAMFGAMEMVATQSIDQHKNITRSSGRAIHCTKTVATSYLCVVHIEADAPFLDAVRK